MALVSGGGASRLNPDAPLFVPAAYRQVEDFSPEWWQLVTTTTWFRDYWLSQNQDVEDEEEEYDHHHQSDVADLLPDSFDLEDFSGMEMQFEELVEAYETHVANGSPHLPPDVIGNIGLEVGAKMVNMGVLEPCKGADPVGNKLDVK